MPRHKDSVIVRNIRSYLRYLSVVKRERPEPFPLTVDDLIDYIKFRAPTSSFRTIQWYLHSLHHHPTHGPNWKITVLGDPRVKKLLERLRSRDIADNVPIYSVKAKSGSKTGNPKQRSPTTKARKKKPGPTAALSQPARKPQRKRVIVQQEPTAMLTIPQVQETLILVSSDADLSHKILLDINRLKQRVHLINTPLSLA